MDVRTEANCSDESGAIARWTAFAFAITGLVILTLMSPALGRAANWETVKTFSPLVQPPPNPPQWPEDTQVGGAGGMAVNVTGNGGVTPGTIYTIGSSLGAPWHAARFSPEGKFELAWMSGSRCGPESTPPSTCTAFPTGGGGHVDIAVDQTTGNVYVYYIHELPTAIRVYRPDGTGPIAEFGEVDASGSIASSPGKIHGAALNENIAVNSAGEVWVADEDTGSDFQHRLMLFKPCVPGIFTSYCYSAGSDLGTGPLGSSGPNRPMVDNAGNLYVSGETYIQEYEPAHPSSPSCTFSLPSGGIKSTAVNPVTGAVFFYTVKPEKVIHQLSPCNGEGHFVENATANPPIAPIPQRGNIEAMVMNPAFQWPPNERAVGLLYAAAPEPCPGIGQCPSEALGRSGLGYMIAPQIEVPPEILSEGVTRVGETSATLNAAINPKGSHTTYIFQYLAATTFEANPPGDPFAGATEAPTGEAPVGSNQLAAVTIGGLEPGTAYAYRVLATNTHGEEVAGAVEIFRTFPREAAGLPDGRAYELVSPTHKNGGEVLPGAPDIASCGSECKPGLAARRYPVQVAPTGDAVAYQGQPFSSNEGPVEYDEYVSKRGPSGWQTLSLSPPLVGDASGLRFEAFDLDPDLARTVISATNGGLAPEAPAGYRNLFNEVVGNRFAIEPLLRTKPSRPNEGTGEFKMRFAGASADLARVYIEANDALTGAAPDAPAAAPGTATEFNLYEWHAGALHLVNVLPGNTETHAGAEFGSGFELADPVREVANFSSAISEDGSRVFWSAASGQVYVREDGEQTRELPDHVGKFLSASSDGARVLLSDGVLYDLETGTSTDLTEGHGGFEGILGQGEDLNSVYFVDAALLTGVANSHGEFAQAGHHNLYAWRNGSVKFVAGLLAGDNSERGLWHASPVQRAAEASPDGGWLAFNSKAVLTAANTVGACSFDPNQQKYVGSVPCEEVYLYNADTGALICASCNPNGAHPLGGSFLRTQSGAQGFLEQPRYLTNQGRLYFDSRDALAANDTNNGVEDVYQFEPFGSGSCGSQGGCVSLLSTGRSRFDSNFLASDPSGMNVFFTTRDRLVPIDEDALIDLYDARVGGGLEFDYAVPPAECSGEGCQPSQPAIPAEAGAASTTVEGNGNVKPKKKSKKHTKKKKHKNKKKSHRQSKHRPTKQRAIQGRRTGK